MYLVSIDVQKRVRILNIAITNIQVDNAVYVIDTVPLLK